MSRRLPIAAPPPGGQDTATFLARLCGWRESPPPTASPSATSERALLYVGTTDLEADLQRAARLGATVVAPVTEVTGSGRFALIEDPHGSRIALWAAA